VSGSHENPARQGYRPDGEGPAIPADPAPFRAADQSGPARRRREATCEPRAGARARGQPYHGGPGLRRAGGRRVGPGPCGSGDVRGRPGPRLGWRGAPGGAPARPDRGPLEGRPGDRRRQRAAPGPTGTGSLSRGARVTAPDTRRRRAHTQMPRSGPGTISFAGGMPDSGLFPTDAVRRVLHRVSRAEGRALLQYYPARGYPPLREFLAAYLLRFGLEVRPDEILIVNGSQQGFDLVGRTLLDPGDFVAIEEPSSPRAMQVFRAFGAQLLPVPMVAGGLDPEHLDRVLERQSPKLLYCQPSAHNPTGLTMRDGTRTRLLEVAARHRLPILEDGFDGSLFFGPPPPAALQALDASGLVIFVGRFSKILFPGLPLGWIAGAPGAHAVGARHLRWHVLQDPVPGPPARLDRGRTGAHRSPGAGEGAVRHPHEP